MDHFPLDMLSHLLSASQRSLVELLPAILVYMSLLITTLHINLLPGVFFSNIHSWSTDLWLPLMFTVCLNDLGCLEIYMQSLLACFCKGTTELLESNKGYLISLIILFQNNNHKDEPVSTVTSPSEPSSNEPDFAAKYNDDQHSESSESSG